MRDGRAVRGFDTPTRTIMVEDPVFPLAAEKTGLPFDDPNAQGYYEVKTWWRSFEDFVAWTESPAFAEAHKDRPPKEMFAGPNELGIHEVFLSTDGDE